jgi:hypothetical protein
MALEHLAHLPLAEAGFRIPIWGIPILLVLALGVGWYQKSRDADR